MWHKDGPIKILVHNKDCVHDFFQRARFNKMILESSIPVKAEEHNGQEKKN